MSGVGRDTCDAFTTGRRSDMRSAPGTLTVAVDALAIVTGATGVPSFGTAAGVSVLTVTATVTRAAVTSMTSLLLLDALGRRGPILREGGQGGRLGLNC